MKNGRKNEIKKTKMEEAQQIKCPKCGTRATKNGTTKRSNQKFQQYYCSDKTCNHHFRLVIGETQLINTNERKNMGITEEQLRMKHDVKFQIQNATKKLVKGIFLSQGEFIVEAGIKAGAGYRDILDHPDFAKYTGKAGSTAYWGHPESIKEMRDENILR